jgi:hypothetical protein
MSVRYEILPQTRPASAGHASFGSVERGLALKKETSS